MRIVHDQTNVTGEYRVTVIQRRSRGEGTEYLAVIEEAKPRGAVLFQAIYSRESLAMSVAWNVVDDLLLEGRARAEHATIPADTGGA